MPIANIVSADARLEADPDEIVDAWARQSGVTSEEMTVNVIPVAQGGKRYAAMAWLYLPSMWSADEVLALGEGLAAAISTTCGIDTSEVQVITSVLESGAVVDAGKTLRW